MPVADLPEPKVFRRSAARRWLVESFYHGAFSSCALARALAGGGGISRKRGSAKNGGDWWEELTQTWREASVRRITLDPISGLVAQDVRILMIKT